jgi:hypothetical protein
MCSSQFVRNSEEILLLSCQFDFDLFLPVVPPAAVAIIIINEYDLRFSCFKQINNRHPIRDGR